MVQTADTIFRDFETDGVMASGTHKPKKSEIRPWGTRLENLYSAAQAGGGLAYATKATMDADLAHAANQIAWVMEDPTAANNGIYAKVGASGSGSWNRLGDLPYSYIKASNTGAGTANAIVATTSIPIPAADGGALLALPIVADNTASPVTVAFNGGEALTVKTISGNDVSVGGLTAGMIVAGYVSGATLRLMTDQSSAAIVADAEAAADRAEAAAASIDYLTVADRTALKAVDTAKHTVVFARSVGMNAKWDATVPVATHQADTAENIYVAPDPAEVGAWVFQDGKAVSLAFPAYNRPLWAKLGDFFTAKDAGLKGDGVDDTDPMDALLAYCGANTCTVIWTPGTYRVLSALTMAMSGYRSLVWHGQGSGNVIIALDTAGDGLDLTLPGNYWLDAAPGRNGLEFKDITFTTANANVGRGLKLTGAAVQGRPGPKILLDNVDFRAESNFAQFWSKAIDTLDLGHIHLSKCDITIGGPGNTTGQALSVDGTGQANSPTFVQVDGGWVKYGGTQLAIGDYVEGVYLTNSALVNGLISLQYAPAIAESGLHVVGGHFNSKVASFDLNRVFDLEIIGALFYRLDTSTPEFASIKLNNANRWTIVGNVFQGLNNPDNESAVHVISTAGYPNNANLIQGNSITGFGLAAIWLGAAAQSVKVGPNSYANCGTRVLDQGSNNDVHRETYQAGGSITLTGGAPSETFTISLPTGKFLTKPSGGSAEIVNADLLMQYDYNTSTATSAHFIVRKRDGTNITGAPYRYSFSLFE